MAECIDSDCHCAICESRTKTGERGEKKILKNEVDGAELWQSPPPTIGRNCDSRASMFSLQLNFPFCHIPILHLMCHSQKNISLEYYEKCVWETNKKRWQQKIKSPLKDEEKRQRLGGRRFMTLKIIQKCCSFYLPDLRVSLKLHALSPSFAVLVR